MAATAAAGADAFSRKTNIYSLRIGIERPRLFENFLWESVIQ